MNNPIARPIVVMQGASKQYGAHWALREINLLLFPGEILGFIGPNGAGKTTLLKILAGLSRVTAGEVEVMGERLDGEPLRVPPGIGVMLESGGLIPHWNGRRNIELIARTRDTLSSDEIDAVLLRVGLDPDDRRRVAAYSPGMRQRLRLALAIMERPNLLLLDEPAQGLDPRGALEVRAILEAEARRGAAILIGSHLLAAVERVCHRVVLVRRGRVLREIIPSRLAPSIRPRAADETDVARLDRLADEYRSSLRRLAAAEAPPLVQTEPTDLPEPIQNLAGRTAVLPRLLHCTKKSAGPALFGG